MKIVLGIVFLLWALFWTSVLTVSASAIEKLGGLAVGWAPLAGLIWFYVRRASSRGKAHGRMLEAAGVAPGAGWDHAEDGAGIAINKASRMVALMSDGRFKVYPYGQVRSWESRSERAGGVVGVGVAAGVAAAGANARLAREAEANTGLFVEVRDIEFPVWRVAMNRETTRNRWMEILRQEINESTR